MRALTISVLLLGSLAASDPRGAAAQSRLPDFGSNPSPTRASAGTMANLVDLQRENLRQFRERTTFEGAGEEGAEANAALTWSRLPQPSTAWHTAIHDPLRDRMIVWGGEYVPFVQHTETWTLSLGASPTWSRLETIGAPPTRFRHTAIHDPVRDRLIVFGGYGRNDVWALTLSGTPTWTELHPSGPLPGDRYDHTAIYDPTGDRMIVFGGLDSTDLARGDAWALTFSPEPTWTEIEPAGALPAGRYGHSAVYDPARDRMVLFGGYDPYDPLTDTWALSLGGDPVWTQLRGPDEAPGSYENVAVLDAPRDRILMLQPTYPEPTYWSFSLIDHTWSQPATTGIARLSDAGHSGIVDPLRQRLLVYGGASSTGLNLTAFTSEVSLLSLPDLHWDAIEAIGLGPAVRAQSAAVYDPAQHRVLLLGGLIRGADYELDAWELTLTGTPRWRPLTVAGSPPAARYGHTAVHDPAGNRVLIFGGRVGHPTTDNDVWVLSLSPTPSWSMLAVSGTRPSPRHRHSAIYDPVRRRMILFGGFSEFDGYGYALNDVWSLDLLGPPSWSQLSPSGSLPPARCEHSAVYDAAGDRMVIFAGNPSGTFYNNFILDDLWALSLTGAPSWTQLSASSGPSQRAGHVAVYDPERERMLVHGGHRSFNRFNTLYELGLDGAPAWATPAISGPRPGPRDAHVGVIDSDGDRLVVFGGWFGGHAYDAYLNDTWILELDENRPPDCSAAAASEEELWPPHGRIIDIAILGVTDPDGDPVTLTVTGIVQDEPVGGAVDAAGVGTPSAQLRAERDGTGDGRVYRVSFEASDGHGGTCTGSVDVCVPHHPGGASCAAGGTWYASTERGEARRGRGTLPDDSDHPADTAPTTRLDWRRGVATLLWSQATAGRVELTLHDLQGRKVRRLIGAPMDAGDHEAQWDGRDEAGARVAPGLYFYRLRLGPAVATGRWVIAR